MHVILYVYVMFMIVNCLCAHIIIERMGDERRAEEREKRTQRGEEILLYSNNGEKINVHQ